MRTLLGLPNGQAHSIELDDWKTRAADAVIFDDSRYCHVEFQTEIQKEMPWRMLEYFSRLQERLSKGYAEPVHITQHLVYVGNKIDDWVMKPPLVFDGLNYTFEYRDLKRIGRDAHKSELLKSTSPFDWILRVLCFERVEDRIWEEVAGKIQVYLRGTFRDAKLLATYFVIAMVLRKPRNSEGLINMLHVKLDELPYIRNIIDTAEQTSGRKAVVRAILRQSDRKQFDLDGVHTLSLMEVDEDKLDDLLDLIITLRTSEQARIAINDCLKRNGLVP